MDVEAATHTQGQHGHGVVIDLGKDAVIANSVSPDAEVVGSVRFSSLP